MAREVEIVAHVDVVCVREYDEDSFKTGHFSWHEPPEQPIGEIDVYLRLPVSYSPTQAELVLSRHFVNCAQEIDLVEQILEIQKVPRRETLAEFESLLDSYRDWASDAEAALAQVMSTTGAQ